MTLFVRLFLLFAFFTRSESKQECAFMQSSYHWPDPKYFNGERWNVEAATFSTSYSNCQITFYPSTCQIGIGKTSNLNEGDCRRMGNDEIECACTGRFCNLNIPFFQNKINTQFQGALSNCRYEGAPPVDTASRSEINCLTGKEYTGNFGSGSHFKDKYKQWRQQGDTTTVTSRLCAIGFLRSCTVQIYKPAGNYGVQYFDSCAYYADTDEAYCQCIHEDHCNADIGYWLAKAKKVIDLSHCNFTNFPVYSQASQLKYPKPQPPINPQGNNCNPPSEKSSSSSLVLVSIAATISVSIAAI